MKKRLGDILLAHGAVDGLQLQSALAFQRQWGVPLGQVVVDQHFCTARQVLAALAEQTGVPAVDLDGETLNPALAKLVSQKVAETHRVVPLRLEGPRESVLVVAIAAPASMVALDAVKSVSGKSRVSPRLATDAAIQRAIGRLYRGETGEAPEVPVVQGFSLPETTAEEDAVPLMVHCMAEDLVGDGRFGLGRAEAPARAPEPTGLPTFDPLELGAPSQPAPVEPPRRQAPASAVAMTQRQAPVQAPRAAVAPVGAQVVQTPRAAVVPVGAQVVQAPVAAPAPRQASVLIYGWGAEAATGLTRVLAGAGYVAKVANTAEVLAAGEGMVVLAPLPSLEAMGQRARAQLLVAGKAPELDLPRAQALGARGFLAAPVDADLLVRAVRRLLRTSEPTLKAVG
jgi:hypothetical protein